MKRTNDNSGATDKVANDHNQQGHQPPTALNQARRTPESRSDRTDQVGSGNQAQSRRGSKNQDGAG
ncbi:hypothetical protein [Diaphorobacter nitroreducens]|uniref:hypothetical protein n=1 Tax=Diaphorobacter nitroreducens TaxID=164759 RepID=UPI0028A2CF49|nr:hypothetical protein [Diaphorobacter nitroreducens]